MLQPATFLNALTRRLDELAARDEQGGARPHRAWGVLLAVLVLCTALLRESGLGFHLPASSIVDERVYIEHLETFQTVGENPAAMPKAGSTST
mgnify:CR=1 FL=1